MEELDFDSQQRRETFARYGLAMYHAQCVEKSLAILSSIVFNKEFLPSSHSRREEIQDEVFAKTIGRLLNRLRKQVAVPSNLDRMLSEAHEKRNWLAHDYFWEKAGDLLTTEGREKMIEELAKVSDFFSKVDAHLVGIYEKWAFKIGITREALDERFVKMYGRKEETI